MANRFSLNEGSLTRRTILHVIAFVVGTALFLAVASLALVTIGKTVTSDGKSESGSDSAADDSPASSGTSAAGKPMIRPIKKKGAAAAKPAEDEDQ